MENDLPDYGVSIIIPTYQEANNIPELVQAIAAVEFNGRPFEVLLMDDNSKDATQAVVSRLAETYPWLKLVVRQQEKSLSQSIIDGFHLARYPYVVTMDADLSHPPDKIPEMLAMLSNERTDLVIGSRYVPGGSVDELWPLTRQWISRFAALLARVYLGANATDPLSGFIAIRRETLESGEPLKPIGWKIGSEIIVKCHCHHIKEIPIHFAQRRHGSSKLNAKTSWDYVRHIFALRRYIKEGA